MKTAAFVSALLTATLAEEADLNYKIVWEVEKPMPYPVSDMSATRIGTKVYIVGGCAADQVRAPWDNSSFFCQGLTDKCTIYDLETLLFTACANAPRARYRHTATDVNGKVWLAGGRDVDDNIIQELDVYDPAANTWSTPAVWPNATSDLACFNDGTPTGTTFYLLGGYTQDYTALAALSLVDTAKTLKDNNLAISAGVPMSQARGDIACAMLDDVAYVSGGWHHDSWTDPLEHAEKYDVSDAKWTRIADLSVGRADKAFAALNGRIFAIAGEHNDNGQVVSGNSKPVDIVEVFSERTGKWQVDTKLDIPRFRFVAVSDPTARAIYLFGGQHYYNATCDCYAIVDDVVKYMEVSLSSWAWSVGPSPVLLAAAAVFSFFL